MRRAGGVPAGPPGPVPGGPVRPPRLSRLSAAPGPPLSGAGGTAGAGEGRTIAAFSPGRGWPIPIRMSKATDGPQRAAGKAWLLAAAALVALRIPHLRGPLDDPHSWRQCDTAYYSLDFFRRGIDLLHPSVCWLGAHRTLIFEFPLPEALSALLYRTFGPDPLWDRLVSLGFFLIATFYLFAFARLVASRRVAWLCAVAYLALPLGPFYSRAAHVDFAATAV